MTNIAREILFETSSEIVDGITFLRQAYGELIDIFSEYKSSQATAAKRDAAEKISRILTVTMQLEEEIFYPAIKGACKESGLFSLAAMSHSLLRYLLLEISSLDADSLVYDIKVRVLGDQVQQYFKETQRKLARLNPSRKIDLWRLGGQLALRKQELCG